MATYSIQTSTLSGITPSYAAVADGDLFANGGREMIHIKNGNASTLTVTITPVRASKAVTSFGTMAKATVSVAIVAGAEAIIGPFEPYSFNSATTGKVTVNYSLTASVTAGVFKLPATI